MTRIVFCFLVTATIVVLAFGYRTSTQSSSSAADDPPAQMSAEESSAPATGKSGSRAAGKTVVGRRVKTKWGPLQVKITVAGKKIDAVDVPVYPSANDHDLEVNHHALPILTKETLKAQSAKVDMVSGATYTSGGYKKSLQSALDKAGL